MRSLLFIVTTVVAFACISSGCGDDPKPPPDGGMQPVPATLSKVELTTVDAPLPRGATQQIFATGVFSDATTRNLTLQVMWSSSAADKVSVSASGVVSSVAPGTATITATTNGVSSSLTVTATEAALAAIAVTPINPSVAAGRTQTFSAFGVFTDGTGVDLTNQVTWASAKAGIATVSNDDGSRGVATGVASGTVLISAGFGNHAGGTMLTVTNAVRGGSSE
jgi:hypothetical protein